MTAPAQLIRALGRARDTRRREFAQGARTLRRFNDLTSPKSYHGNHLLRRKYPSRNGAARVKRGVVSGLVALFNRAAYNFRL